MLKCQIQREENLKNYAHFIIVLLKYQQVFCNRNLAPKNKKCENDKLIPKYLVCHSYDIIQIPRLQS